MIKTIKAVDTLSMILGSEARRENNTYMFADYTQPATVALNKFRNNSIITPQVLTQFVNTSKKGQKQSTLNQLDIQLRQLVISGLGLWQKRINARSLSRNFGPVVSTVAVEGNFPASSKDFLEPRAAERI